MPINYHASGMADGADGMANASTMIFNGICTGNWDSGSWLNVGTTALSFVGMVVSSVGTASESPSASARASGRAVVGEFETAPVGKPTPMYSEPSVIVTGIESETLPFAARNYNMFTPGPLVPADASGFMGTSYVEKVSPPEGIYAGRVFDDVNARAQGRWLSPPDGSSPGIQSTIDRALRLEWNTAAFETSAYITPGTVYYQGLTAPQGGIYLGGTTQYFVPDPSRIIFGPYVGLNH
jgi:hypothetical protein